VVRAAALAQLAVFRNFVLVRHNYAIRVLDMALEIRVDVREPLVVSDLDRAHQALLCTLQGGIALVAVWRQARALGAILVELYFAANVLGVTLAVHALVRVAGLGQGHSWTTLAAVHRVLDHSAGLRGAAAVAADRALVPCGPRTGNTVNRTVVVIASTPLAPLATVPKRVDGPTERFPPDECLATSVADDASGVAVARAQQRVRVVEVAPRVVDWRNETLLVT